MTVFPRTVKAVSYTHLDVYKRQIYGRVNNAKDAYLYAFYFFYDIVGIKKLTAVFKDVYKRQPLHKLFHKK